MKRVINLLSCVCFMALSTQFLIAQNLNGITGIRDTSYTNMTAFKKDIKKHSQIKLVKEFDFKEILEKYSITYCTHGSRELKLDVFQKRKGNNDLRTAIIIVHGGGWRSGDRSQHYPLAQKLANLGYVCFTPEYRLSTEALFPAAVFDLKAAIRWVRKNAKEYQIDPEQLVISGFSAGGELAAFLGTTPNMPLFEGSGCDSDISSHANAVINMDGTLSFTHPESGEGDDGKKISAATHWFGYAKKENPILWEAASPLSYVSEETPPTLFLNSSVNRMHAGRDDYIASLKELGIYSKVISFETAPHSFILYHPWFELSIKEIDAFLKFVF